MALITRYIKDDVLDHLSDRDKKLVLRLLARASEQGNRRGFQQGFAYSGYCDDVRRPYDIHQDGVIANWRYGNSLDKSPWLDVVKGRVRQIPTPMMHGEEGTSLERLEMENGELWRIGLQNNRLHRRMEQARNSNSAPVNN
jgi:hypothetical protein